MAKTRNKKKRTHGSKETAAGGALAYTTRNQLLGRKRMYHGTTEKAWEGIKKKGLHPAYGGSELGAGAAINDDVYRSRSRGKVHLTRSPVFAGAFSGLTSHKHGSSPKVVVMDIPYTHYRKMPADPDMSFQIPGRVGKVVDRNAAVRSKRIISPEFIHGAENRGTLASRASRQLGRMPKYIRRYPGRFARGVAGATLGTALAVHGLRHYLKRPKRARKKKKA